MMTQEEVLAQMESSFAEMPEDIKTTVLFTENGTDWTPTLLLEAVRNDTEFGRLYAKSWAVDKEEKSALLSLLDAILGPPGPNDMTCGNPACPHCKGEVRPFTEDEIKNLGS